MNDIPLLIHAYFLPRQPHKEQSDAKGLSHKCDVTNMLNHVTCSFYRVTSISGILKLCKWQIFFHYFPTIFFRQLDTKDEDFLIKIIFYHI